jgi:hypothetical protein
MEVYSYQLLAGMTGAELDRVAEMCRERHQYMLLASVNAMIGIRAECGTPWDEPLQKPLVVDEPL